MHHKYSADIIAPLKKPLKENGGLLFYMENLASRRAVIKHSVASMLKFRGKARIFNTLAEAEKYLLDENKAVILHGYAPKGASRMPEFGNYIPIPPIVRVENRPISVIWRYFRPPMRPVSSTAAP